MIVFRSTFGTRYRLSRQLAKRSCTFGFEQSCFLAKMSYLQILILQTLVLTPEAELAKVRLIARDECPG